MKEIVKLSNNLFLYKKYIMSKHIKKEYITKVDYCEKQIANDYKWFNANRDLNYFQLIILMFKSFKKFLSYNHYPTSGFYGNSMGKPYKFNDEDLDIYSIDNKKIYLKAHIIYYMRDRSISYRYYRDLETLKEHFNKLVNNNNEWINLED